MSLAGEDTVQRNFTYEWVTGWVSGALVPIGSVLLAVIVGGFVVLFSGGNPLNDYSQLVQGAFGSTSDVSETLISSIPLLLAGLSVAFAFRAGLFNIGANGQIFVGAICATWIGYKLNWPGWLLVPVGLAAGAFGGAVWAGIAGLLKAWRGAHEVITTMMLNYVAIQLVNYLLQGGPMETPAQPGSQVSPPINAALPVIVPGWILPSGTSNRLHAGLLVALAMAGVFSVILWRTTLGYKLRAVGLNPKAAAYAGINVGWNIVIAMCIAGAFAGLAGAVNAYGIDHHLSADITTSQFGFDAIAVALLGKNTAIGVVLAAILFGALEHGGQIAQQANISSRIIQVLEGLIIFFVGAEAIVRYLGRRGLIGLPRYWRKEVAT